MTECLLCSSTSTESIFSRQDNFGRRDFYRCFQCNLVFVPSEYHISFEDEHQRYLTHNNDPSDPDYRAFLSRLWVRLRPRLGSGTNGLDFGAGPGPALAEMVMEDGFNMALYDPFFHPDQSVLNTTYSFICCTETLEHLRKPYVELMRLERLLESGGWLGIMTGILDNQNNFPDWYYHRDPTHICFYSKRTMEWISDHFMWDVIMPAPNVVLFRKPVDSGT